MPQLVVLGAMCKCSFGLAPSSLVVTPKNMTTGNMVPAANIGDSIPMTNVMPFGMCTTQSNPAVAAATSAALGTPTPAPCIPVTTGPWSPGAAKTKVGSMPALTNADTCNCAYGGVITITNAGQTKINVS